MSPLLPSKLVAVGELLQHVSRTAYRGKALYFGRDGANRYDSPDKTYGVLYLSFDLTTALMKSVFQVPSTPYRLNFPSKCPSGGVFPPADTAESAHTGPRSLPLRSVNGTDCAP